MAPRPPVSRENSYNSYHSPPQSNRSSINYSESRPASTSYHSYSNEEAYPDMRPKSTTLPARDFTPSSHHAHHAASNEPDPFEIFKRFFGTQDFRQASMR